MNMMANNVVSMMKTLGTNGLIRPNRALRMAVDVVLGEVETKKFGPATHYDRLCDGFSLKLPITSKPVVTANVMKIADILTEVFANDYEVSVKLQRKDKPYQSLRFYFRNK